MHMRRQTGLACRRRTELRHGDHQIFHIRSGQAIAGSGIHIGNMVGIGTVPIVHGDAILSAQHVDHQIIPLTAEPQLVAGNRSNQAIDVTRPETMANLVEAIIRHENGQQPYAREVILAGVDMGLGRA